MKNKAPDPKEIKPGAIIKASDGTQYVVQGNKGSEIGLRERGTNRYLTLPHRHLIRYNWRFVFDTAPDEVINNNAPVTKLAISQDGNNAPIKIKCTDYGPLFRRD